MLNEVETSIAVSTKVCLEERVWTALLAQAKWFLVVVAELVTPAFGRLRTVGIAWVWLARFHTNLEETVPIAVRSRPVDSVAFATWARVLATPEKSFLFRC